MKEKVVLFFFIAFLSISITNSYSQETNKNEIVVSDTDLIIIFSGFIIAIIAIFLYLARHQILRKKTDYDQEDFESKKDKDYEKYHSEWTSDDYIGSKKRTKEEDEFRKSIQNSNLPNYYEILKISKDASQDEIKKQFRSLVKEWHPDRNPDPSTKEKMAEINKAYEVLSDIERKKNYDKYFNVS